MIKKRLLKKISILLCIIIIIFIITVFPNKTIKINNEKAKTSSIYILDNNNYVSKIDYFYESNNVLDIAKEIIEILTINSPYEIKNGFYKVIPENTKLLNISLLNNIITLNFSKELLNVDKENEYKMIEAIVYSLTSIEDIKGVIIKVENLTLNNLPNSKKNLPKVLDRSLDINPIYDLYNYDSIYKTTIYYIAEYDNYNYYIPVTKYTNTNNKLDIIITELKSHSTYNTNIIDYMNDLEFTDYEITDNNIILNISSINDEIIETVKYALSESIKENYNKNIIYYINNHILL